MEVLHRRYSRRTPHKTRVELLYRANAALLHCRTRLGADEVEHTFNALLPKAPRPQRYGRPMPAACAPMASALTTSVPRRNPLSMITVMRPFTAAMISGSASIV